MPTIKPTSFTSQADEFTAFPPLPGEKERAESIPLCPGNGVRGRSGRTPALPRQKERAESMKPSALATEFAGARVALLRCHLHLHGFCIQVSNITSFPGDEQQGESIETRTGWDAGYFGKYAE
jgi:hypothetical protein